MTDEPLVDTALIRAARHYAREAIAALVLAIRTGDPRVRVAAAVELLNRGYGRPAQTKEPPPIELSLADIERMIAHAEQQLQEAGQTIEPPDAQANPREAQVAGEGV